MASLQHVALDNGIAVLRLDRPRRRNALDSGLLIELVDALARLAVDDELRVLVFSTTSTRALCSGVDVTEELDHAGGVARMKSFSQFLAALEAFKAAALRLAAHVAAHSPEGVSILKAAFRELDGAQGRVAHENELLEVFQRKGAGLPQGPRP